MNRGILLGTLEWAAALGICHIPPRPPMYMALCLCASVLVCVCMCVWAFLPSSTTGWHGVRTTTAHSDQNKPRLFFTTLAHRPAKQTNQGQRKFRHSMSLRVSFSGFHRQSERNVGEENYLMFGCHKMLMF